MNTALTLLAHWFLAASVVGLVVGRTMRVCNRPPTTISCDLPYQELQFDALEPEEGLEPTGVEIVFN